MAEDCISRYRPVLPVGGLYLNDRLIMMVRTLLNLDGNGVNYLIDNNRQLNTYNLEMKMVENSSSFPKLN